MLIQWENNDYIEKLQAHYILRVIHTNVTVIQLRKQENHVEFAQLEMRTSVCYIQESTDSN